VIINFYTHLELYNKIAMNKEIIFQKFKIKCVFFCYIAQVKMEKKAIMSVVLKKKRP
jgi:hypothetical protein